MPMNHNEFLEKAKAQYDLAYYLLKVTYPIVKDPKLLLRILDNIFTSLDAGMEAVLAHDKQKNLVSNYGKTFRSKLNVFYSNSVQTYNIKPEFTNLMRKLNNILEQHKTSPMEFKRNEKFVICSSGYEMQQISIEDIESYLEQNKSFIDTINGLLL